MGGATEDYTKVPTKELIKDGKDEVPATYGYGVRHIQLLLFFLCMTTSYIARGHAGVTVVAMSAIGNENKNATDLEHVANLNNTIEELRIKDNNTDFNNIRNNVNETTVSSIYRTYEWDKPIQEMIFGSFFMGYFVFMFPVGMVCQRWGGKIPLQFSLFINGVVSILTPWLALWGGYKAVCACRIMQGVSQAGTYPGLQTLISKWASSNEVATISSYVHTGTAVGTVIAFQLAGFLAESYWSWPSTYWVVGALCMITFLLLTLFGAATPSDHKSISDQEKNYIQGRIHDTPVKKQRKVPWKAIMTSKPVWAVFATHIGSASTFVFFFTQTPSYVHYVLGVNLKNSGVLSSLPYVLSIFTCIMFGNISDYCTSKNILSNKNARIIFNCISQLGMTLCLLLTSFTTNVSLAVFSLVVGMGSNSALYSGWMITHIDLAPNFAGTLMAVGNVFANLVIVLLPVIVSVIVVDVTNILQWRIMFGLMAALTFGANAIFIFFMTSDRQPWNDYDEVVKEEDVVTEKEKI